ncbi:MAG: FAD:protein FMN transferase [Ruminococcaceae bacterium]|nr:FAD:protein FMN transferase [Oscillospiraceae bacterium]
MKKLLVFLLIVAMLFSLTGCGMRNYSETGFFLDTVITITVYDDDNSSIEAAFNEIERLEKLLSNTISDSDVCRVNNSSGWVEISPEMQEIVEKSLNYYRLTGGAFDITINPLTALWNVNGGGPVPSDSEIQNRLRMVDFTKVQLHDGSIYAGNNTEITLGGVAKGYIADKICELLKENGVEHGIINLGGNVVVFGGDPDGGDYTVGIRDPFGSETDLIGTVSISNGTVVTSGAYERFFVENDRIYHHIIDPATGYPSDSGISGVTIVAQDSALADALSTAVYIMGVQEGLELIEALNDVECIIIDDYGDITLSSGMDDYFVGF